MEKKEPAFENGKYVCPYCKKRLKLHAETMLEDIYDCKCSEWSNMQGRWVRVYAYTAPTVQEKNDE